MVNSARRAISFLFIPAFLLLHFISFKAFALEINLVPLGSASGPSAYEGTGNLSSIMTAAAEYWEDAITDDQTVSIFYGWADSDSHGNFNDLLNWITFGNEVDDWYLDGTPNLNEEYYFLSSDSRGFPSDKIVNSRYLNGDELGRDLYTNALHEIGHALGFNYGNLALEGLDGELDITSPRPFAGSVFPIDVKLGEGAHLDENEMFGSLMTMGVGLDSRILPSQVDILAVAEAGGFEDLSLGSIVTIGRARNENGSYAGKLGNDAIGFLWVGGETWAPASGTIVVDGGARLDIDGAFYIVQESAMRIEGQGSKVTSSQAYPGLSQMFNASSLLVEDGAEFELMGEGHFTLGGDGSRITVTGKDSSFHADVELDIGTPYSGHDAFPKAKFSIDDGATAVTGAVFVHKADVLVKGEDSHWSAESFRIGTEIYDDPFDYTGPAKFTIRDNGSILETGGEIHVGPKGELYINGKASGVTRLRGGLLAPGESVGTAIFDGDLFLESGILQLEIESGEMDAINSTGDVIFGEDLIVQTYADLYTAQLDLNSFFTASLPIFDSGFTAENIFLYSDNQTIVGDVIDVLYGGSVASIEVFFGSPGIAPVPIPAAAWLFGSALLGLGVLKRKKA